MCALTTLVDVLRALRPAQEFDGNADMYVWAGPTPDCVDAPEIEIAARIGVGAPNAAELVNIERADAEVWLSLFARISLCHGIEALERDDLQTTIMAGFDALGPDARFYSNGSWTLSVGRGLPEIVRSSTVRLRRGRDHHYSWQQDCLSRMPQAITDGGIIAVGSTQSFLFWVSEDD